MFGRKDDFMIVGFSLWLVLRTDTGGLSIQKCGGWSQAWTSGKGLTKAESLATDPWVLNSGRRCTPYFYTEEGGCTTHETVTYTITSIYFFDNTCGFAAPRSVSENGPTTVTEELLAFHMFFLSRYLIYTTVSY
jgi:hypothetical protein